METPAGEKEPVVILDESVPLAKTSLKKEETKIVAVTEEQETPEETEVQVPLTVNEDTTDLTEEKEEEAVVKADAQSEECKTHWWIAALTLLYGVYQGIRAKMRGDQIKDLQKDNEDKED